MKKNIKYKKDVYYTEDDEWIDFQGSVAYVGACAFKLKGIKEVKRIDFNENNGVMKKGEVLASIVFEGHTIQIHMPVDGKILSLNELLVNDERDVLLQQPEEKGWLAIIVPSSLYERSGLLMPDQYNVRLKSRSTIR